MALMVGINADWVLIKDLEGFRPLAIDQFGETKLKRPLLKKLTTAVSLCII